MGPHFMLLLSIYVLYSNVTNISCIMSCGNKIVSNCCFKCILFKITCNPMHPLYGALPVTYVQVLVTRGAVIAHKYTYLPPHCRTSQHLRSFIFLSVCLWNDLGDPIFDGVGLVGFKSRPNAFLLALLLAPFLSPAIFPFSSFIIWVGIVGLGSSDR